MHNMKLAHTPQPALRRWLAAGATATCLLAATLGLSGCGGGGGTFDVAVVIAGQPSGGGTYGPGSSPILYVRAGRSIELDASESVYWTMYVAGTAVSGSGTTIRYAGVDVTLTEVSSSRIIVDTYAPGFVSTDIPVTLVATSTFDAAQVATVNILITN